MSSPLFPDRSAPRISALPTPAAASSTGVNKRELNLAQIAAVQISKEAKARHAAAQKAAAAAKAYQQELAEIRREQARERLAEIKRRIEQLKSLLLMFGAKGGKGLLRELKQLAGELKQIAGVLKDGSAGATSVAPGETSEPAAADADRSTPSAGALSEDAEGRAAYAATQALSEGEPSREGDSEKEADGMSKIDEAAAQAAEERDSQRQQDRQRQEDAQSLQAAARGLRELLILLKNQLSAEQRQNKDTRKQLDELGQLIRASESMAAEMQLPAAGELATPDVL